MWFLLTFEGLIYSLHTVMGDEVHIGGCLVEDLHIVGDEVHDSGRLVVDLHAVEDWHQRVVDSDGSHTDKLCLARWFGSDWPAHRLGRGAWRRD